MSVSSYALIKDGVVVNAVVWDGKGDLFPEYETYEIQDGDQVGPGFTAEKDKKGNWIFSPPPAPELTKEQIAEKNQLLKNANISMKASLLTEATQLLSILQDAVEMDMATQEETDAIPLWKKYRLLLSRVDAATSDTIEWPIKPTIPANSV